VSDTVHRIRASVAERQVTETPARAARSQDQCVIVSVRGTAAAAAAGLAVAAGVAGLAVAAGVAGFALAAGVAVGVVAGVVAAVAVVDSAGTSP
jgi:hypothetical protein